MNNLFTYNNLTYKNIITNLHQYQNRKFEIKKIMYISLFFYLFFSITYLYGHYLYSR